MILLGIGAGMAFNPMLLAAMSDVAPEESGLASGVVNTSFMMGGAVGLAVLASIAASRTDTLAAAGDGRLDRARRRLSRCIPRRRGLRRERGCDRGAAAAAGRRSGAQVRGRRVRRLRLGRPRRAVTYTLASPAEIRPTAPVAVTTDATV